MAADRARGAAGGLLVGRKGRSGRSRDHTGRRRLSPCDGECDDERVGAAARSVENAAGISLGDLIDFCARCVALGIPESTKVRASAGDHQSLVAIVADSQLAMPPEFVNSAGAEYGTIIDGGVVIEIPGEE
jgi:hypothetical protein